MFLLQDEKIELCRFSKDGTKPFLFCTIQKGIFTACRGKKIRCGIIFYLIVLLLDFKIDFRCVIIGNKALTAVWDMSTWKKIGHKRLLRKPASIMSVSLDGKYLAL